MSLRQAILGFLDLEPSTGYTLGQRFSGSLGSFWSATQSQIYRELHDLEHAGLARVEVIPQPGKPPRKVYSLRAAGRAELGRLLAAPVEPLALRDPVPARVRVLRFRSPGGPRSRARATGERARGRDLASVAAERARVVRSAAQLAAEGARVVLGARRREPRGGAESGAGRLE
ncbi:MAG TPA: PadR family transcriptional regulator [Polyangiaceae bacterium]|nr:PadR family transcriptional regulator [Polyangiaceae bacterium]